jgi:nicotinate-nucleotide--dimethylbenzimidazole phosphoribosyltransferase
MQQMQVLQQLLQKAIDSKTKPLGALGMLETIALQVGMVQKTIRPSINKPHIVVFAADHGIAATGLVNPYPQQVTAQMVRNFLNGGAAINVFCRQHQLALTVVDAGVNNNWTEDLEQHPNFLVRKMAMGTNNYLHGPAMTEDQCKHAIRRGSKIIQRIKTTGCNTVGFGEMGIGNTSSAALIMSSILQLPVAECTGRGTGANEQQLLAKIAALEKAAALHQVAALNDNPMELLSRIGGFELAMMVGAFLEAYEQGMICLVDGFICTAALLVTHKVNPAVISNCIFAHCSEEQGHQRMLQYLNVQPLLQLGLRLGEGTGAALAVPIVQSAVLFLNEMASFESAGVSEKQDTVA